MKNKLVIPLPRTNFLKNSFRYYGAVIWNSLPLELRQAETINSFRRRCHNFFYLFIYTRHSCKAGLLISWGWA